MTYEEIKTKVEECCPEMGDYDSVDDGREAWAIRQENALMSAEWPERVAFKTLVVLDGRKGFEWWWRPIDPDDKESIFRELVKTVEESD